MQKADIGLIGLAVMGQNLVLNMNDHGKIVAVFNRTIQKVEQFLANEAKGTNVIGTYSIEEFCEALIKPRRVMLMVKAGEVVDSFIQILLPHLEKGDIIIDGGNSLYTDTQRRVEQLEKEGILYVGAGVSGGEEGARFGPSIMPGGAIGAWSWIKDIFQGIAAKVDKTTACCEWVGNGGSGHYVKMVHNGIEYGDMQLICEAYEILKNIGLSSDQISQTFAKWNTGVLDSFLVEITAEIFAYQEGGEYLIEKILDTAGQKGTGKWTGINALDLGIPLTLIAESVFARCLSARKNERVKAAKVLQGPQFDVSNINKQEVIDNLEQALYASKIISYTQGYMLLREASQTYDWNLDYGAIALMWRGGCIIRSAFLNEIKDAFTKNTCLENLLLDDFFSKAITQAQSSWRKTVLLGTELGVSIPCISSALSFYDGYRSERLPANLLQAQRDFFGAHTYERLDKLRGEFFHTNWTGKGGNVSSSTYDV